jgi:hypothetical protein
MTRQRPRRERALYRRHAYQRRARRPTRGNGPPHAQQPAQGLGHGPHRPHDAAHHGRARSDASICCARLPRPTEYPRSRQAVLRFLTPTNGQPRSFQAASTQSRLCVQPSTPRLTSMGAAVIVFGPHARDDDIVLSAHRAPHTHCPGVRPPRRAAGPWRTRQHR